MSKATVHFPTPVRAFSNSEFGTIRTLDIDNKPYFIGIDVAKALGYSHPSSAVIKHCKGILKIDIPFGKGSKQVNIIAEDDLHLLINNSKLPTAEKLSHWLLSEVLPTICKNGSQTTPPQAFDPDTIIQLATQLKEEQQRLEAVKAYNKSLLEENAKLRGNIKELKATNMAIQLEKASSQIEAAVKAATIRPKTRNAPNNRDIIIKTCGRHCVNIKHSINLNAITYYNVNGMHPILLPYQLDSETINQLKPILSDLAINGTSLVNPALNSDNDRIKSIRFFISPNIQKHRQSLYLFAEITPELGDKQIYQFTTDTPQKLITFIAERYIAEGNKPPSTWRGVVA